MDLERDDERLRTAAHRFRLFFQELRGLYLERDDVLDQAAMALLTREHHLITGPPGTAKSGIASAIVGRIVDEASGEPSLFARQVTESTVQTDLVGPIDFKALTETGRTEHFTDEGLLGAVHAHLDEVLDGRDMLLRSTLNLLHERELKQGTRIVHGAIECALMTTNRYLAEVLEDSRDRLLAFVDRIAYVGFVPKGFADPEHLTRVLEVQAGGRNPPKPSALLTIQDLDILQAATEAVHVDPHLFARLAQFLAFFEEECASAVRSDPSFIPTRYLSTRTAVRLAHALKAACVLDVAFDGAERPLSARAEDLSRLRLSLLLSGPTPTEVEALLARETDARERRQLEILRTERELFERAMERLPAPPPIAEASERRARSEAREAKDPDDERASASQLLGAALPEGLCTSAELLEDPIAIALRLAQRADVLERRAGRDEARWLRGRALALVAASLESADAARGKGLDGSIAGEGALDWAVSASEERLHRLRSAIELRTRMRARGADEDAPALLDAAIRAALSRAKDDLAAIWDEGFFHAVERALEVARVDTLEGVLGSLRPAFDRMAAAEQDLERLGVPRSDLRALVVGPRIAPLLRRVWGRFEAVKRPAVIAEAARLCEQLHAAGLRAVVSAEAQLEWAIEALLRTEPVLRPAAPTASDRDGYRSLRAAEASMPIAYAIVHVFVALLGEIDPLTPREAVPRLCALLSALPSDLRARIAAADLDRVERAVGLLERFWNRLEEQALSGVDDEGSAPDEVAASAALRALVTSGFFHITTDEAALARFALEAELVAMLLPASRARADALSMRASALGERSRGRLGRIFARRSQARWTRILGP